MKHTVHLTFTRILSVVAMIALLMTLPACKQAPSTPQETTASAEQTTASEQMTAAAEQTTASEQTPKDPAETVPFRGLNVGEEMLELRYEYLVHGDEKFVLRYGIFSTTEPGYLNGTGLYLDFLNSKLEYVTSHRYGGVGFIALITETTVDPTLNNRERTWNTVPTFSLASYDGETVTGESKRLWYQGDSVSVLDFVNIPQFPLNKYGERNFFTLLSHAPEDLGKAKGAHILAYQDGTGAVLVDQQNAPVIDDALITSVESITMQQLADLFGLEYKG